MFCSYFCHPGSNTRKFSYAPNLLSLVQVKGYMFWRSLESSDMDMAGDQITKC